MFKEKIYYRLIMFNNKYTVSKYFIQKIVIFQISKIFLVLEIIFYS